MLTTYCLRHMTMPFQRAWSTDGVPLNMLKYILILLEPIALSNTSKWSPFYHYVICAFPGYYYIAANPQWLGLLSKVSYAIRLVLTSLPPYYTMFYSIVEGLLFILVNILLEGRAPASIHTLRKRDAVYWNSHDYCGFCFMVSAFLRLLYWRFLFHGKSWKYSPCFCSIFLGFPPMYFGTKQKSYRANRSGIACIVDHI